MSVNITFYGVRGSTPCACESTRRYGGNTACVVLTHDGGEPILFDLGTGLRFFGLDLGTGHPFRGTALLSHLHWDHVQGIPFFAPWLCEGSRLDVWAPTQDGGLESAVRGFIRPPYFPVSIDDLPGDLTFHEVDHDTFTVGRAEVRSAPVPHVGPTLGYRVTVDGVSVAYLSDHQQPGAGATHVDPAVLDLCAGVDLLIHDAQYDEVEFVERANWGHCTVAYAVEVAAQAGARRLALFHHDPGHSDERVDELLAEACAAAAGRGIEEVLAAGEGLTISLSPAGASSTSSATVSDGASTGASTGPVRAAG